MTTIKARLNCSRLGSDGTYPLVIRIIHERVKREVYTSYRLRPEEFEVCSEKAITKSRVKEKVSYIREVNECINYIKEELKGNTLRPKLSMLIKTGMTWVASLLTQGAGLTSS